jgi:hypothetical protein
MDYFKIIAELELGIKELKEEIDRMTLAHEQELEEYKKKGVAYDSSLQTKFSGRMMPLRLKKQNLDEILERIKELRSI